MNMITTTMNPITTKGSFTPGSGELVPSRYALRVGEIDVLVVSDGVLPMPAAMWPPTPTRPSGRPG